ncbi:hypothetical protein M569_04985 [Genlisea aurea]|uniref:Transmembrane protein n=1 Tax=Genlisea aurea TaxID=192259 RepID=S8CXM2_9LAMI|nr:hypothetical protein M569_04985 [Genlisea aurea]
MLDWAPILLGLVLFILLSPGVVFLVPGNSRHVEIGTYSTNGKAIILHTLLYFAVYTILLMAVRVRIYFG